ncbi:30S ribosomal protein S17e [Methanosphaera cuniculi]|uniref:Small ribosomal subunit protein eS17 n=1 Tax=Methanosphaera cuniculi TaxID=1077256 RepID=A0A2A2HD81_9EURY|nr:30S ribosomal protein S17e [Methanosphaera cuniculi]PAV07357.1 30S ribosomal protein S17e [Methanosphaera cuniculi]PWL07934.1 30S ribosomal protein S17e [Methanosphaera cuniculi]
MGNIRTTFVKRTAKELLEEHGDKFNNDFENNKQVVAEYSTVSTKHLRNQIAGYATHLMDQ